MNMRKRFAKKRGGLTVVGWESGRTSENNQFCTLHRCIRLSKNKLNKDYNRKSCFSLCVGILKRQRAKLKGDKAQIKRQTVLSKRVGKKKYVWQLCTFYFQFFFYRLYQRLLPRKVVDKQLCFRMLWCGGICYGPLGPVHHLFLLMLANIPNWAMHAVWW